MKNRKTKIIVFSALLAAIIALCTRFTGFPIPGTQGGYVHLGDTFVFLAATFLPMPYALLTCALGGALADIMYGSMIYVVPTAIVKSLMSLMFFGKRRRFFSARNLLALIPSIIILVCGYYGFEVFIYHSLIIPLPGMIWNLVQGIFSAICFIFLAIALDAAKVRDRLDI